MANKFLLIPEDIYRGLTTADTKTGDINLDFSQHAVERARRERAPNITAKHIRYNQALRRYLNLRHEREAKPINVAIARPGTSALIRRADAERDEEQIVDIPPAPITLPFGEPSFEPSPPPRRAQLQRGAVAPSLGEVPPRPQPRTVIKRRIEEEGEPTDNADVPIQAKRQRIQPAINASKMPQKRKRQKYFITTRRHEPIVELPEDESHEQYLESFPPTPPPEPISPFPSTPSPQPPTDPEQRRSIKRRPFADDAIEGISVSKRAKIGEDDLPRPYERPLPSKKRRTKNRRTRLRPVKEEHEGEEDRLISFTTQAERDHALFGLPSAQLTQEQQRRRFLALFERNPDKWKVEGDTILDNNGNPVRGSSATRSLDYIIEQRTGLPSFRCPPGTRYIRERIMADGILSSWIAPLRSRGEKRRHVTPSIPIQSLEGPNRKAKKLRPKPQKFKPWKWDIKIPSPQEQKQQMERRAQPKLRQRGTKKKRN